MTSRSEFFTAVAILGHGFNYTREGYRELAIGEGKLGTRIHSFTVFDRFPHSVAQNKTVHVRPVLPTERPICFSDSVLHFTQAVPRIDRIYKSHRSRRDHSDPRS